MGITSRKKSMSKFQTFGTMNGQQVYRFSTAMHFNQGKGNISCLHQVEVGHEFMQTERRLATGFLFDKIEKGRQELKYSSFFMMLHRELQQAGFTEYRFEQ